MFRKLLWITVLLCLTQAKFKSLNCQTYDSSRGNFSKCEIKAISRTKNLINVVYDFFKTYEGVVEIRVQFFKRANGWHPFLYNFTIDICQFLRKKYHMIAMLTFDYLKPYTNLNHTCPYKAGTKLLVKNLDLNVDQLRSRFPIENGEYALGIFCYVNKNLVWTINGSILYFDYKSQ